MKLFSLLSIFFLSSCVSSLAKIKPEDIKDEFSKGPCKFGRVLVEKDPELPNSGFVPAVFCTGTDAAKKEKVFALDKAWMNYNWSAVDYDGKDHYVAVLDWTIEGGFQEVPVIESTDRGKTWIPLSKIVKPHFSALVKEIKINDKGIGDATIDWDGSPTLSKVYTRDGGKTWKTQPRK